MRGRGSRSSRVRRLQERDGTDKTTDDRHAEHDAPFSDRGERVPRPGTRLGGLDLGLVCRLGCDRCRVWRSLNGRRESATRLLARPSPSPARFSGLRLLSRRCGS